MIRPILLSLTTAFLSSCGADTASVAIQPIPIPTDGGSTMERKMASLMRGHPKQKRPIFRYDARLAGAARAKARDMAKRGYFGHTDPDGYGSNFKISQTGYALPPQWLAFKSSNQGESLLAGEASATKGLTRWLASGTHRSHILALDPFYQNQTRYGLGYHYDPSSNYRHYWVLVTAPPEK
ncbi:CAP domain-containing protein [Verrucomicrobiaceae bacterium 227]